MTTIHDAITARATVHAYLRDALPAGALERALEAAIAAPNHRMTEPWRFLLVGRVTRARLVDIAVELKAAKLRAVADAVLRRKIEAKLLDPATLVCVLQALDPDPEIEREDYAAVACAIQNLMLSLHGEGVGSKWSTGAVTREPRTHEILGIDPRTERVVGFVWAGIARAGKPKPPRRRAVDTVVQRLP